jgi:vesicle-fusing ATPase
MSASHIAGEPPAFTPGVQTDDPLASYWLSQVTLRLRREVSWLWRERRLQSAEAADSPADAPPTLTDRAVAALDLRRYADDKNAFFRNDVTGRYLSDRIAAPPPELVSVRRGSFGWVAQELALTPIERFVLAMALLPPADSAAAGVIVTCANDPTRTEPTLALAQGLWDQPDDVVRCFDPAHPLFGYGLLTVSGGWGATGWQSPLTVAPAVVRELLFAGSGLPASLQEVTPPAPVMDADRATSGADGTGRANRRSSQAMRVIPVIGASGSALAGPAAADAAARGLHLVRPGTGLTRENVPACLTVAWLRGCAMYLPVELLVDVAGHDARVALLPLPALPLTVFVGMHDRSEARVQGIDVEPSIHVAALTHAERVDCWRQALPSVAPSVLSEIARRFRYERDAIERIAANLAGLGRPPTLAELQAAARGDVNFGGLAQAVAPRFELPELMLPAAQARQVEEIVTAMNNLTRVHYEWGTARAWNEGGLTALFAGPPGTGKTMAAEALASAIGLPLYRIDLSQVVNKYVGETEKNLRRVFDTADAAELILFFDEADSLFGKRSEVKDAHDRYANLEISYLLERMERFKGLAILATNRRKDLDPGFARRLRFVIEFPLPGVEERHRIWRSVIPPGVDSSALDFRFLAQQFPLAGGHIRAIVFQACLQTAAEGAPRRLEMPAVIRAVDREHGKLDRVGSLDQFGPYAPLVAAERKVR